MKYSLILIALLSMTACGAKEAVPEINHAQADQKTTTINVADDSMIKVCPTTKAKTKTLTLTKAKPIQISVVGQGVAPVNTSSPAQAYALAKRAATADAYRLIAEKVKGVSIDGQDLIKNMMVKRSTVRTSVAAMVRNANIVETTFKDGLCEVEMEITLSHADFAQ